MNPRLAQALRIAGYVAWFGACFVILTYLTFPWSRVRDQAIVGAANSGLALQMDSLRPRVVGFQTKALTLGSLADAGDEALPPWLETERVRVKTGIGGAFSTSAALRAIAAEGGVTGSQFTQRLLMALGDVSLDSDLYGGELELDVSSADDISHFLLNIDDVDLAQVHIKGETFELNPTGNLIGKADVTWPWEDARKSAGGIDLRMPGLILSGLKIRGIGLPEATFTTAEAHLKLSRGKAEFRDTAFLSDVVEADISGFVNLTNDLMRSRLSLKVKFKLRSDLDNLAKAVMGSNPRHKDDDGWYHYQVTGTLQRPNAREASVRRGGGKTSRPVRSARTADGDDDDDDDAAAARKARLEKKAAVSRSKIDRSDSGGDSDRDDDVEAERERLREERLKRREERRLKREELMQKRRERQSQLDAERGDGRGGDLAVDCTNFPENIQTRFDGDEDGDDGVEEEGDEEVEEGDEEGEEEGDEGEGEGDEGNQLEDGDGGEGDYEE